SLKIRCEQALGIETSIPEDGYHGEYLQKLAQACITEYGKETVLSKSNSLFAGYAKSHLLAPIQQTLAQYNITFNIWFSEKALHESGEIDQAIDILTQRGFIYEKDGAWWFKSTEFGDDKDRVVK